MKGQQGSSRRKVITGCGVKRQVAVQVSKSSSEDSVPLVRERQKHKQQGSLELTQSRTSVNA